MALEYIFGLGTTSVLTYAAYCNLTFYKNLKKTLIMKQSLNEAINDKIEDEEKKTFNEVKKETLDDVFRKDGVHLYSEVQPKSGIPPKGDMGTFFLKPSIHIAKKFFQWGFYDKKAK